jgi:hypothetical protein
VVTYNVVVEVDNPEQILLPGMTAYVNIVVAQRKDVLLVPNAALRFKPAEAAQERRRQAAGQGKARPAGMAGQPARAVRERQARGRQRHGACARRRQAQAGQRRHRHHRQPVHRGRQRRAEGAKVSSARTCRPPTAPRPPAASRLRMF